MYMVFAAPPGKLDVIIVGGDVTTMLKLFEPFPTLFVALTTKLNVPAVVGVPEISPEASFKIMPGGSEPLNIDQDIGVVPLALSV